VWCHDCAAIFAPARPKAACPFCGEAGSDRTCIDCQSTHALDGFTVLFPYADPRVRRVLIGWKYRGDPPYAEVITRWIHARVSTASFLPSPPEGFVIVPIPLHIGRLRARGFNQAETVSHALSEALSLPHLDLLERIRRTSPQAKIEHAKRRAEDLAGAFRAGVGKASASKSSRTTMPSHIILCDDVFTTGATMDAAAKALKAAGVKTVWGFATAKG